MMTRHRYGFTIVELLIVSVLGAFIAMTAYQVLVTNSRTHSLNSAKVQGQQVLRAGLDVLFGELREISAVDGDLVDMRPDSLTIRAQRTFGLVCGTNYAGSPPELTLFRVGPFFQAGDSVVLFAENDTETTTDDVWLSRAIQSVDTTATCGTDPGQLVTIPNLASTNDTVRIGAPARAFEEYTYGVFNIGGEDYLGRRAKGATSPDPLVGPVAPYRGVAFRYLDVLGNVTTVDTLVAQIEVSVRYRADLLGPDGNPLADSLVVRVFPRN